MNERAGQNSNATREDAEAVRSLVLMPAFNEEETLGRVLDRVGEFCPDFDRLVVDDGSTDRTAEIARRHGAHVVSLPFNSGYGCAIKAGLLFARENGYGLAVMLDADGQHDPRSIAELVRPVLADEADVVLGSRYGNPEGRVTVSALQRAGHRYLSGLLRLLTGRRISDPMSGYQAISRRALWFYVSDHFPDDYPDADVLLMLHRAGIRFEAVPAVFHPRTAGRSMHGGLFQVVHYFILSTLRTFMVLLRPKPREKRKAEGEGLKETRSINGDRQEWR